MEPSEAAETIREVVEDHKSEDTKFRSRAALVIALMAMMLAIATLASVAILSYVRFILKIAIVLGVVATVLTLNGFFLVVKLPF